MKVLVVISLADLRKFVVNMWYDIVLNCKRRFPAVKTRNIGIRQEGNVYASRNINLHALSTSLPTNYRPMNS